MSSVGMKTKVKNARKAKRRADLRCKGLAMRVRYLEAQLEEAQAELAERRSA